MVPPRTPVTPSPTVPESELVVDFVRSSGPGGQKVNKTSSKAQLRWHVGASVAFTDEQKARIRAVAGGRLNAADEIVIAADTERSQPQNRQAAIDRLHSLVAAALTPKKKRIPVKVTRAQRRKRLEAKRIDSRKKSLRRPPQLE